MKIDRLFPWSVLDVFERLAVDRHCTALRVLVKGLPNRGFCHICVIIILEFIFLLVYQLKLSDAEKDQKQAGESEELNQV